MVILVASSGEQLLKPGVYEAVITGIEERERDGQPYLLWSFEVRYAPQGTTVVRRPTGLKLGPRSLTRAFVEAALGRPVRDGEKVDTDTLVGAKVRVVVNRITRPDGSEANRIESVLPVEEDELPF